MPNDLSDNNRFGVVCPDCGGTLRCTWKTTTIFFGDFENTQTIPAQLPVNCCEYCEFESLDEYGQQLQDEALCRHFGILCPREIKDIRVNNNMSSAEFAVLTGIDKESIARWERGSSAQSLLEDRYLRILSDPEVLLKLKSIVKVGFGKTND